MALPVNGGKHLIPAILLIYRPRKDERLSWPSWLTCSGWFTHISGHPSAAGREQDRESSSVRDRRSTTVPRHQPRKEGSVHATNQRIPSRRPDRTPTCEKRNSLHYTLASDATSLTLSVCLSHNRPQLRRAAGLLLSAVQAEDIDR